MSKTYKLFPTPNKTYRPRGIAGGPAHFENAAIWGTYGVIIATQPAGWLFLGFTERKEKYSPKLFFRFEKNVKTGKS